MKKETLKQLVVTCDGCRGIIAFSDAMDSEEAARKKSSLTMNPFGAPRCRRCKIEPYSDISLMHTIEIRDFDESVELASEAERSGEAAHN